MKNKSNAQKVIEDIKENYRKMEREIATQLNYQVNNHHLTAGTHREEIWVDFFRRIVPKKFNIARSVFIIDSQGSVSNEVDIAIYDEQYTPYVFNYGHIKFIPVEAVAAVVQCKSEELKSNDLLSWVKSVKSLKTSRDSVVRLESGIYIGKEREAIQSATTPIKILCYISKTKTRSSNHRGKESFDIIIEAYQKNEKKRRNKNSEETTYSGNLNIEFKRNKNLYDVLCQYNRGGEDYTDKSNSQEKLKKMSISDYSISNRTKDDVQEYTLLSFIFQFNQMLMMINNPMFFPHKAYVDMFNGKSMKDKNTKEK